MSDDNKAKRTASGPSSATAKPGSEGGRAAAAENKASVDRDVGQALRSVYAKAVGEEIPAELLDLLGKLS